MIQPILDSIDTISMPVDKVFHPCRLEAADKDDLKYIRIFLSAYSGSKDTFTAYRRDIERLLLWLWHVEKSTLRDLTRDQLTRFLHFIDKPPKHWIMEQVVPRVGQSINEPNPNWRPFSSRGKSIHTYQLSSSSMKAMMASISTCLTYLVQEQYLQQNVMLMLRQKNRYIQREQQTIITRKLTSMQWRSVIACALDKANGDFEQERTLFILSAFYLLGLRISELSVSDRHTPSMGNFYCDENHCYWYTVVGKGNKYREIAVCDDMLSALVRYRKALHLSAYPHKMEQGYLLPKVKGRGGLGSRQIRKIVMNAFKDAVNRMRVEGDMQNAQDLDVATVHWLRHTAISHDVTLRPTEHVRDDAGHENITITDRYINVSRKNRHASAKQKPLLPIEGDDNAVL